MTLCLNLVVRVLLVPLHQRLEKTALVRSVWKCVDIGLPVELQNQNGARITKLLRVARFVKLAQ